MQSVNWNFAGERDTARPRESGSARLGGIPQAKRHREGPEENHGMQADWLRSTGTLAWLVHDALPAISLRAADGRADQALWEKG